MRPSSQTGEQLALFDWAPSERATETVTAARSSPELHRLAAALPSGLRLGTSSWSFPGWVGLVYEGTFKRAALARRGLGAYAQHPLLGAVGVDRGFYSPLPASVYSSYLGQVPDAFSFVVKAPAQCTAPRWPMRGGDRNPLFMDPEFAVAQAVSPMLEGLPPGRGVLLFQFPPLPSHISREPRVFAERLARLLAVVPSTLPCRVELRNPELLCEQYVRTLRAAGAGHCFNVHPRMPGLAEQRRCVGLSPGPLVVRWMLNPSRSYAEAKRLYAPFHALVDPDPAVRVAVAELCEAALAEGTSVIVVANNKAEGSAPLSLVELARVLVERGRLA